MKAYLLICVLVFGLCPTISGQDYEVNAHVVKLVDSARISFCKNDTVATITILEKIERLYPTDGLVAFTNKVLADLYIAANKTEEAKAKLLYAITYKSTNYPAFRNTEFCNKILNVNIISITKADLCVSISQLYLRQQQYDSSLYFLNLADNKFLPYKDCANGMYMYQSYLSPYFADHYLAVGDTTKALARLLDFFMKRDGNTKLLTQKLKSLLLQKWTQKEITAQIDKGLKGLTFTKEDDDEFTINLTLFGHTIKNYGYGKTKVYRDYYLKDPSLKMLRDD